MGNDTRRRPVRQDSPFREWVSDNLRYIILIAIIAAAVIALLFFLGIIRLPENGTTPDRSAASDVTSEAGSSVSGNAYEAEAEKPEPESAEKETGSAAKAAEKSSAAAAPEITAAPSVTAEPENEGLQPASDEITSLVSRYFKALAEADPVSAEAVVESISEEDQAAIANGIYMRDYADLKVYTYPGDKENEYVVLVSYTYLYRGYETRVPALTALYVLPDANGALTIASDETQERKSSVITAALADEKVMELRNKISAEYDKALESDPDLAAYISSLG